MSKSKFNYEYLPKGIVSIIKKITKSEREYRTQNNYLLVVGLVYHHQMSDEASYYQYTPLSQKYWIKVIGSHYSIYVTRLIDEDVIQKAWVQYVSEFGDSSRVKGYRINPELLKDNFSLIKYAGAKPESDTADVVDGKENGNYSISKPGIKPDLIRMQKAKALEWIENNISSVVNGYLNPEYIDGVPLTLPVLVRIYHKNDNFSATHMSVEAAQKIAEEQGKSLLYYKDKFIVADEEQFTRIAKYNLSGYYKWQVKSFMAESFNFSRNNNTLRVYSKLSSLPTALLPFLRINGQYIQQGDLKCSQFTLFANLINFYLNHSGEELIRLFTKKKAKTFVKGLVSIFEKHKNEFPVEGLDTTNPEENLYNTNDIYKFLVDTLQHDFYGIIKSELGLPQRANGKSIAFRTVFSKPKPENELVRQFRHMYPSIISIINDFKDKYKYNEFAIGLQRVEAVIFIDNIWKEAKKSGINCFTRHDSLVFPIKHRKEVEKIIADVFESFDFICRVEYEEFNTEEIQQRLVHETEYIDSIDDSDELLFYTLMQTDKENREHETSINLQEQLQDAKLPEHKEQDYFEHVSLDTLWELFELDAISLEGRLALEEDIANLQSNYPIPQFTEGTNKLITKLIDVLNS